MRISTALSAVLIVIPAFLPIIMQPHSAADMIFRGPFLTDISISVIVLLGVYFVRKKYNDQAFANDKDKKIAKLDMAKKILPGLCVIMFVAPSAFIAYSAMRDVDIRSHGERIMAKVLDIYVDSCRNHDCREYVEYQFTPMSGTAKSQSITGYGDIANSNDENNPDLVFAKTQHHVPVAYNVRDPRMSALNFDDRVFKRDPTKFAMGAIGFLGVAILIFGGVVILLVNNSRRKLLAS